MNRPRIAFTNRWMFGRGVLDESVCKDVIRCVLGIEAERIEYLNAEQVLEPAIDSRGVRMDVYAREANRVYDIEMQAGAEPLIGQRFRYYQSALDTTALAPGKDYDELPESFIIFMCAYDPFDRGIPLYTLERHCREAPVLTVDCTAHLIALNARAWDALPYGALRDLLQYTQNGSVGSDPLVRRIDRIVTEANDDRKWVSKVFYCVSTIEENDARRARILERLALKKGLEEGRTRGLEEGRTRGLEEGRAQGREEGRAEGRAEGREEGRAEGHAEGVAAAEARYGALVDRLLAERRLDDLHAITSDDGRRAELLAEFGL